MDINEEPRNISIGDYNEMVEENELQIKVERSLNPPSDHNLDFGGMPDGYRDSKW